MIDRTYTALRKVIEKFSPKPAVESEDTSQYHVDFFYNDPSNESTLDHCARIQRDYEKLADWLFSTVPACDLQQKSLRHLKESMMCALFALRLNTGKVK